MTGEPQSHHCSRETGGETVVCFEDTTGMWLETDFEFFTVNYCPLCGYEEGSSDTV